MALVVKDPLPGDAGDVGLIPESARSPGVGNGNPPPVFLPGEFHGQGSPARCSPWDREGLDMTACAYMHAFPLLIP